MNTKISFHNNEKGTMLQIKLQSLSNKNSTCVIIKLQSLPNRKSTDRKINLKSEKDKQKITLKISKHLRSQFKIMTKSSSVMQYILDYHRHVYLAICCIVELA